jgi:excisionase family DNA binding protein
MERLLTTQEVAHWLGYKPATIQDWVEAGKLTALKPGGRLRFRASDVEAWLEGRRTSAGGEAPATPRRPSEGVVSHLPATPLRGGEADA